MSPYNGEDSQLMIPDLAVYIDAVANIKFELFVIEVKKQDNRSNESLKKDSVKLGKEMKMALDKLIFYNVESRILIGLHFEGKNNYLSFSYL